MPRSGNAPYIIFISSIYIVIANVRLRVPRERVVQLSEPEEVAYDRVQGSDELVRVELLQRLVLGRPKVGLGIYIYSCHAGELFGFVPVARDEQAFSC